MVEKVATPLLTILAFPQLLLWAEGSSHHPLWPSLWNGLLSVFRVYVSGCSRLFSHPPLYKVPDAELWLMRMTSPPTQPQQPGPLDSESSYNRQPFRELPLWVQSSGLRALCLPAGAWTQRASLGFCSSRESGWHPVALNKHRAVGFFFFSGRHNSLSPQCPWNVPSTLIVLVPRIHPSSWGQPGQRQRCSPWLLLRVSFLALAAKEPMRKDYIKVRVFVFSPW